MNEKQANRPYYTLGELAALTEPELLAKLREAQTELDVYVQEEDIDPDPAKRSRGQIHDRKLGRLEMNVENIERQLQEGLYRRS